MLTWASPSAAAEEFVCFGFLGIVQKCRPAGAPPKPVLSNFCGKMRSRIQAFVFTADELAALSRQKKQAFRSLRKDYEEECLGIKTNAAK